MTRASAAACVVPKFNAGRELGDAVRAGSIKAIHTYNPLFSFSIHSGDQNFFLYTYFFRTHPSSISSFIHYGIHLSLYLNIFM
jgi:hypothetical protein